MNMRRILTGTVVLGILANVLDYLVMNFIASDWFSGLSYIVAEPPMMWLVIGDFAAAFMLMWAWDKVGSAWGKGPAEGAKFGLFIGAIITFPMTLFWQMYLDGFGYMLAWKMIILNLVWYAVLGAVAAMLDGKEA